MVKPRLVLLDLNYTLIGNQEATRRLRFPKRASAEQYRMDLVEALEGYDVVLITARPERHKADTMAVLVTRVVLNLVGAYFNTQDQSPPDCKKRIMHEHVFPAGHTPEACFAIESNPRTRAMYARLGVESAPYSSRLVERLRSARGAGLGAGH